MDISNFAKEKFHIKTLKPYQTLVITKIIEEYYKKDKTGLLVILPTGYGKSLCFQIPALLINGITLVIYPLLSLMEDQRKHLQKLGIKTVVLKGNQKKEDRNRIFSALNKGKVKIIITNYETLISNRIQFELRKLHIKIAVVDEAHIIPFWGKSFRPACSKIGTIIKFLNIEQIIAFTATADNNLNKELTSLLFSGKKPHIIKADVDRENIYYQGLPTISRKHDLLMILKNCDKPALVFCNTRHDTFQLFWLLKSKFKKINSRYYNAGLSDNSRIIIENWFLNSKDGVLFSTSAYGMGVDKKDIRTVIHYNFQSRVQEYLQESGRAGRDGKQSMAWVLIDITEKHNDIEKIFLSKRCRRKQLLKYLDQNNDVCTGCDYCNNTLIKSPDGLDIIKKLALNFLFWTPSTMAAFLTGMENTYRCPLSYRKKRYFSYLNYWDTDLLETAINKLIICDYIKCIKTHKKGKMIYRIPNFMYNHQRKEE